MASFEKASVWKGGWQIANSFGGYALLWVLSYFALDVSWWLAFALAAIAGGFLIRIFVILHDCGHGSLLPSRLANNVVGTVAGVLTLTPYRQWTWAHARHHATTGDLDRRGVGDIWTMTVEEYRASSWRRRAAYRLVRHPAVLFGIAPSILFVIRHRFSSSIAPKRERRSVWWTNLALAVLAGTLVWIYGPAPYLFIQLTIMLVAGAIGVWLFYVQHQFEEAYWNRTEDWDWSAAALEGSSYYQLPAPLEWLTGNIGFHHVHHLNCRIPNYNLRSCHNSHPMFARAPTLTLRSSFRTARLRLWDEQARKLIGFKHLDAGRLVQAESGQAVAPDPD